MPVGSSRPSLAKSDTDRDAAAGRPGEPIRRQGARRDEEKARQGAGVQLPRRVRTSRTRLSGGNCGTSTTDGAWASTSGSSLSNWTRIRHLVLHRRRAGSFASSISPRQGVSARRHVAGRAGTCNREPTSRCSRIRWSAPSGLPAGASSRHRRSRKSSPKLRWPA